MACIDIDTTQKTMLQACNQHERRNSPFATGARLESTIEQRTRSSVLNQRFATLRYLGYGIVRAEAQLAQHVEIEIGVLQGRCLGRRIPKRLRNETAVKLAPASIGCSQQTTLAPD